MRILSMNCTRKVRHRNWGKQRREFVLDCLLHSCLEYCVHESSIPTCYRHLSVELLRSDIREDGWTKQQTFPSPAVILRFKFLLTYIFPRLRKTLHPSQLAPLTFYTLSCLSIRIKSTKMSSPNGKMDVDRSPGPRS